MVILCSVGLFILFKYWNTLNYINGGSMRESRNLSIKQIIIESIRIQYRGGNAKKLNRIFTSDFIKQIDENPHFYKKKIFYTVDKDFMNSFRELNQDQATVSVKVEDLSGSYIQIITLTKGSNGKYQISKIEFDI